MQSFSQYTYVQPGYFETLGIPLYLGRSFDRDAQNATFVVLSESAAKQIFGSQNPVGRIVRLAAIDERPHQRKELIPDGPTYQVIGVVRDTRGWEFDGSDSKQIYLPLANDRIDTRPLLIRTQQRAAVMIAQIEKVVASLDPEIVTTTSTLEDSLRQSPPFIGSTIAATVASSLGGLGLLLALVGIFGTVGHIVALRTREVGIRMAIGAQKHHVLGQMAGMVLALGVAYILRSLLYEINALDGFYFVAVSAFFCLIALLAAYAPARRALQIDPVVALRYE